MKMFLYGIIFLLIFIILKAFYFDEWLEKRALDANISTEANQSSSEAIAVQPIVTQPIVQAENNRSLRAKDKDGMPVTELGDSIAEKLKGKI